MAHQNMDFLAALDAQIEHLNAERDRLKPVVDRFELIAAQLDLVKRTRNAFAINGSPKDDTVPSERPIERERIGEVSRVLFNSLKEAHRIVHLDELFNKLNVHGLQVSRNAMSGALGRAIQLKQVARRGDDLYEWIGE